MESGTSSFTGRGRVFFLSLIAIVIARFAVGASFAQEASGTQSQTGVSTQVPTQLPEQAPAQLPAAELAGQTPAQAAVSASGAATGSPAKTSDMNKDSPDASTLVKLGPGDLLEVNVYNVPELTSKVRVSNGGDVYLPLIDYVHVDGLTQEEAQTLVEKRLEDGGFVRSPHVTIFVDEAASQGVTILGEVMKSGIYPDVADHKLYEVIAEAGGFTATASRKISVIRRNLAEPIRIELPRNLADDVSGNIEILPGDTISVQRAPVIYVVGDVGRPTGLLVDNGTLTVLQALALAGGTNRTAKMSGARIIRKTPTGMTETPLELKKMLEAKTPDVTLQADDILFVPVSGGRVAAGRTFEAVMAMTTALGIYAVVH
jgi:polysaccharide export outer membrane protein